MAKREKIKLLKVVGREVIINGAGVGGAGAILYGTWQISSIAGWIVLGVFLAGAAVLMESNKTSLKG